MKQKHYYLGILLVILILIGLSMTSCSKNGYGCKGNSKIMTRVR